MVTRQYDYLMEDAKKQLQGMGLQGKRLEETLEGWKKDLKERAEFDVRVVLLLEATSRIEKLEVNDKDLDAEYEKIAQKAKVGVEKVKAYYQGKGAAPQMKWQLLQGKVLNWLIDHAKIKEVSSSQKSKK